jgi:hypothetical protein
MHARHGTVGAAFERLAVEGDRVPAVLLAGRDPLAEHGLEGGGVQRPEDFGEGGFGGGFAAAEAEGMGQAPAVVAAELGNGLQRLVAGEDGDDRQGEDGG